MSVRSQRMVYSKTGPGPMAALRFKWTARREDHGDYYVDETIGENSRPITSGPMSKEAAIQFVDDRASEVRRRFERLKGEMTGAKQRTLQILPGKSAAKCSRFSPAMPWPAFPENPSCR